MLTWRERRTYSRRPNLQIMHGRAAARVLVLLAGCAGVRSQAGARDGDVTALCYLVDATPTPALRAFDFASSSVSTLLEYDADALEALDASIFAGRERRVRPHSIAAHLGALGHVIYWADAEAGVLLGFARTGSDEGVLAVVHGGLETPEQLVLHETSRTSQTLYWADLGTRRIESCRLDVNEVAAAAAGTCPGAELVLADVGIVSGLAVDSWGEYVYYADMLDGAISRAPLGALSAAERGAAAELLWTGGGARVPMALDLDGGSGSHPPAVYWLDVQKPASLHKLAIDRVDNSPLPPPSAVLGVGLSRPVALAVQSSTRLAFIFDAGTHALLRIDLDGLRPVAAVYANETLEARGLKLSAPVYVADETVSTYESAAARATPRGGVVAGAAALLGGAALGARALMGSITPPSPRARRRRTSMAAY